MILACSHSLSRLHRLSETMIHGQERLIQAQHLEKRNCRSSNAAAMSMRVHKQQPSQHMATAEEYLQPMHGVGWQLSTVQ